MHSPAAFQAGEGEIFAAAIFSSFIVSLSGLLPFLVFSDVESLKKIASQRNIIGFAVGSLLGDVFLHILPETWTAYQHHGANTEAANRQFGILILAGFVLFLCLEKILFATSCLLDTSEEVGASTTIEEEKPIQSSSSNSKNADVVAPRPSRHHVIAGYLNLLANCTDNFTHGLAIGASYLTGMKVGLLTTSVILVHEIPHEIGDVAILMRSGFSVWNAARAQLVSGSMGTVGAMTALMLEKYAPGTTLDFVLPFTAGGFLYVALVSLLPDLLTVKPEKSGQAFGSVLLGIASMWSITILCG